MQYRLKVSHLVVLIIVVLLGILAIQVLTTSTVLPAGLPSNWLKPGESVGNFTNSGQSIQVGAQSYNIAGGQTISWQGETLIVYEITETGDMLFTWLNIDLGSAPDTPLIFEWSGNRFLPDHFYQGRGLVMGGAEIESLMFIEITPDASIQIKDDRTGAVTTVPIGGVGFFGDWIIGVRDIWVEQDTQIAVAEVLTWYMQ